MSRPYLVHVRIILRRLPHRVIVVPVVVRWIPCGPTVHVGYLKLWWVGGLVGWRCGGTFGGSIRWRCVWGPARVVGWWVHLHVVPRHTLLKPGAVLRRGRVTPYLPPEAPAILLEILKSMHVVCSEEAWLERWGRGLGLVTHTGSIALRAIEKAGASAFCGSVESRDQFHPCELGPLG